jgi:TonB family protein
MFSLDAASRLVLDAEALAHAGVELEPSLVSRASFAPRHSSDDAVALPEEAEPPRELPGNPRPEFPPEAQEQGQQGEVVLRLVVRTDGSVGKIEVLKGAGVFSEPTLTAVRRWRFAPAKLGGNPLAVYKIVKVPFRLR